MGNGMQCSVGPFLQHIEKYWGRIKEGRRHTSYEDFYPARSPPEATSDDIIPDHDDPSSESSQRGTPDHMEEVSKQDEYSQYSSDDTTTMSSLSISPMCIYLVCVLAF